MMDISRRFFILGSVTAIAAAAISTSALHGVLSSRFTIRRINYIGIWFRAGLPDTPQYSNISLRRDGDDDVLFHGSVSTSGYLMWTSDWSQNGEADLVMEDRALIMSCDPPVDECEIILQYNAEKDARKPHKIFYEAFLFRNGKFSSLYRTPCSLDPDHEDYHHV